MRRFEFFVFFALFLLGACSRHQHSPATSAKDKPVLRLNHCDHSPECFHAMSLLYQWPANDLTTPYGARLRIHAVTSVMSGIILDRIQKKHERIQAIANALKLPPRIPELVAWTRTESQKLASIPEVKTDALALERIANWMADPGCKSTREALKTWHTFPPDIQPMALVYAISAGFSMATAYAPADQWLFLRRFTREIKCMAPKSNGLAHRLVILHNLLALAVRAGMNHPYPALATIALNVSDFLTSNGIALPFVADKKGVMMGVDMPKAIRPPRFWHHPDYFIVVTRGNLRIIRRPVIKGLGEVSKAPQPKVLLDIDLAKGQTRTAFSRAQEVLQPLFNTWKYKQWGYVPILCDRRANASDLLAVATLAAGATYGYPVLAVFDQDRGVPGFIPFNSIAAQRGFVLPDGRFGMYNRQMQPVRVNLRPGMLEIVPAQGGPSEVFGFAMNKLPDFRPAYRALTKTYNKNKYLELHVDAQVPVWVLVALMQVATYQVSPSDMVSVPAFLGAGLDNLGGPLLHTLFERSVVLPGAK